MSTVWHFGCNHDHSNLFAARAGMSEEERRVESEIIRKKFRNAILLTSTFFLVEAIGGYLCKSLAIWSDASHLLSDVISLAISLGASHLAERPKDPRRSTFGLRRVESLAALLSMVFLIGLTLSLIAFSIWRLVSGNTGDIDGRIMSGVSLSGIFVNLGLVAILGEHHHVGLIPSAPNTPSTNNNNNNNNVTLANPNDGLNIELPARFSTTYVPVNQGDGQDEDDLETLRQSTRVSFDVDDDANEKNKGKKLSRLVMGNVNLQATYLHVLGDLLQSIGIFIAALFIWIWPRSAYWIDPMCTTLFSSLVMMTTVPVVRTSLSVLLLQVPPSLDGVCIRQELEAISGVERVEKLRIYAVSQEEIALTVHLFITKQPYDECFESASKSILGKLDEIARIHSISDATAQVELEPEKALGPITFGGIGTRQVTCLVCPATTW